MPAARAQRGAWTCLVGLVLAGAPPAARATPPWQALGVGDGLPSEHIEALASDRDGALWIATRAGLARYDGRTMRVWGRRGGPGRALPLDHVVALEPAPDGDLRLVFADGRQGRLVRASGRFEADAARRPAGLPWPPAGRRVDRAGTLWVVDGGRLRHRDPAGAWAETAFPAPVRAIHEDAEGGLWVGLAGAGLRWLPPAWRAFGWRAAPAGCGALLAWEPQGGWAASETCLHRWHAGRWQAVPGVWRGLVALVGDGAGGAWVALREGLLRFGPDGRRTGRWLRPGLVALERDREGGLWALDAAGQAWRSAGRRLVAVGDAVPGRHWMPSPEAMPWLWQKDGVRRWDGTAWRAVAGAPGFAGLPLAAAHGRHWWVRGGGALVRYAWDGAALRPAARRVLDDDLGLARAGGLGVDARGDAWLATARGLWRLPADGGPPRRFGHSHGLAREDVPAPLAWSAQGTGWLRLPEGLARFSPDVLQASAPVPAPAVELQALTAAGVEAVPGQDGFVRLGPDHLGLRLRLHRGSFVAVREHRFLLELEGARRARHEVGAEGEWTLPALAPGHHRVRVASAEGVGPWSDARTLTVLVSPPWWRTREVALLVSLALLVAAIGLARIYRARRRRREAWRQARRRQAEAERHSEAKSRFLAMLGHEIRTPMTGVLGMAELLQGGELAPEQRRRVDALEAAGRHLLRLVNDALDLARIEAGKLRLEPAPFDLRALLDEVAGLLRPLAVARGLGFRLQVEADAPQGVLGDATRVRQILLNLGHNAIKFCDQGGVRLSAGAAPGGGVRLEVQDSGPGLARAQQARLFHRFEPGREGPGGGSGLGLAICRELAHAMGGRIAVDSEPGHGTRFRVDLPLPAATGPAAVPAPGPADVATRRVLLVEDDPVVAAVATGLLERAGHQVQHAPHGLAALAALAARRYDLAFLDLDLPALDGLELARLLRARGDDTPLVALTARADAEAEPAARAAGMAGFLRKPVTGELLARAVATWARAPAPAPPA